MPAILTSGAAGNGVTMYYAEFQPATDTGTSMDPCGIGVCSALPTDGTRLGQTTTCIGWRANGDIEWNGSVLITGLSSWISTDLLGLGVIVAPGGGGASLVFYKNGTVVGTLSIDRYLSSPIRFVTSIRQGTSPVYSMTAAFAKASWTYTPASAVSIGAAATWVDENSTTLSGGNLTAGEGTFANDTPVRASVDISF